MLVGKWFANTGEARSFFFFFFKKIMVSILGLQEQGNLLFITKYVS